MRKGNTPPPMLLGPSFGFSSIRAFRERGYNRKKKSSGNTQGVLVDSKSAAQNDMLTPGPPDGS